MSSPSPARPPAERADVRDRKPEGPISLDGLARFAAMSAAGLVATGAAGVLFFLLLVLVVSGGTPLEAFDVAVVDAANEAVRGRPWAVSALRGVTNLGGSEAAWLLLSVAVVWLLIRRAAHLAAYVAVVGIGSSALNTGVKALVERTRPALETAVTVAPADASFPSGHALGTTVTYGALLLVFLPAVAPRLRPALVGGVIALIIAVGLTRIALGVHYPSDVLGGWLLGALWLTVTAVAFRRWRQEQGKQPSATAGLAPEDRPVLEPAPAHDAPLPAGWHSAAQLLVAGVVLWGLLLGIGLLITDVLEVVQRVDLAVVQWVVQYRSGTLTTITTVVSRLGGTVGIVIVQLIAVPLAVGFTRRWAPAVFLLTAVIGETALFLGAATVVERLRPSVPHLSETLPPTSSFPSGHVAAAAVTYGGIALLVLAWTRSSLRHVVAVLAVLVVLAVAFARLYRGVHYPTDVLVSMLYGAAWLAVCWRVVQPARGAPQPAAVGARSRDAVPRKSGARHR